MFRLLKLLFVLFPVVFGSINTNHAIRRSPVMSETYEIYPIPQSVEYGDSHLIILNKVNIVTKGMVDDATKEKAVDVISLKPVLSSFSNDVKEGYTNVVLATYASNYVNGSEYEYIPTHIDSYYLEINENDIIIVGKDTDAIYYALATLQFIFEQSSMSVRTLVIKDYSQSALRGFIEGYYGIPWTAEERKELMRFGSRVKTNIYIYAPKDDVYHSTSWRSLYNDVDYRVLKEQVEVGNSSKTRLAWAIHPFMNNPLTRNSYNNDLQIIKNKFEQVYSAGVRQFVVSADDINMPSPTNPSEVDVPHHAELHKDLLNDLVSWVKSKGDCYDLVFVPTTYNNTDEKCAEYFETLMDGLDESVQIMWTGQKVCSSMNNMAYDAFHSYSGTSKKPFIWMNWPVNDYAINYLLMGEGEVFNKQYENDDAVEFSGLVVNPMQLAEASKFSIWACGDYSWNTKDFDMHQSYLDSFKYIEKEETENLMKVVEHLTNTSSKFEDAPFKEAESLKPLIEAYKEAYLTGDYEDEEDALIDYLYDLNEACGHVLLYSQNKKLVENIAPWVNAVMYTGYAAETLLYLVRYADTLDDEALLEQYNILQEYIEEMNGQEAPNLIPGYYSLEPRPAYACTTVLRPFIDYLENLILDDICVRLGIDTGIKYANLGSIYQGKLENMMDENEETYCWFGSSSSVGSYVRIDLVTPQLVKDVTIVFGNSDPNSLDRMTGDVEVSVNGKDWTKIGEFNSNRNIIDIRDNPINARFVRFYCTQEDSHWVAIREIYINNIPSTEPVVRYSGFNSIHQGSLRNIVDGDDSTYCWFSSKAQVGGYVQFDYLEPFVINDVTAIFGTNNPNPDSGYNDKFTGLLQYSLNGEDWTTIGSLINMEESFDLRANPINARYLRMYANEDIPGWVAIRELKVNVIPASQYLYTYHTLELETGDIYNLCDGDESTYCHFSKGDTHDAYIILDVREVKQINNIIFKQNCSDYDGDIIYFFKVYVSSDKETWTQVGEDQYRDTFNLNLDLSSDNISARYIKIESDGDLLRWVAISEFDINK